VQLPDSTYVLGGTTNSGTVIGTMGILVKLEKNGDVRWALKRDRSQQANRIINIQNGYAMAGTYYTGSFFSVYDLSDSLRYSVQYNGVHPRPVWIWDLIQTNDLGYAMVAQSAIPETTIMGS
jgi:hypothetical protein